MIEINKKYYKINKLIYFICFLTSLILMYIAYKIKGITFSNDGSVLVLDFHGQYVYYYEYLRDALWGEKSLLYCWSRNLSGEMLGIFTYYLASPFSIIPCIFSHSKLMMSLELMLLLKLSTASVTMCIYLKKQKGCKDKFAFILSILYAFSTYFVTQLMNPMWLDAVIYLPLVVYGVEKLITDKKQSLFIIAMTLTFFTNYYIGYMVGIFVAFYFLNYYIKTKDFLIKDFLFTCLRFFLSVVCALATSMMVILPAYNSLKLGKLEFSSPDFSMKTDFTIFEFLSGFLPDSYSTVRPNGLPLIACGIIPIILLCLYFVNKNIKTKDKIINASLLALLFMCMYINPLNMMFHGFQEPNWLPFRYSFLFVFMIISISSTSSLKLCEITNKQYGGILFGLILFIAFIEDKNLSNLDSIKSILLALVLVIIYICLLKLINSNKRYVNMISSVILILLVCGETLFSTVNTLKKIDKDVIYSTASSYTDEIDPAKNAYDELQKYDDSLYRSEKTFFRTMNDNMSIGMRGISHTSSTMNSLAIKYLYKLGFVSKDHLSKYDGETKFSNSLLGIKYIMSKDQPVEDYQKILTSNGIDIYYNSDALSVAFLSNQLIKSLELTDYNPFENQNRLGMALTGLTDEMFSCLEPEITYENVSTGYVENHFYYAPEDSNYRSRINFTFTAPNNDEIFMYLPTIYETKVDIYVNDYYLKDYFEDNNYGIVHIGKFKKDENVTVSIEITNDNCYMMDQYFYYFNADAYNKIISKLKENQLEITSYTDTEIKGTCNADENMTMYTSIPYENGWNVKIDGKKAKVIKLNDATIGFDVPKGEHTIELNFMPDYFIVGIIISVIGLAFIVITLLYEKNKLKSKNPLNKIYNIINK